MAILFLFFVVAVVAEATTRQLALSKIKNIKWRRETGIDTLGPQGIASIGGLICLFLKHSFLVLSKTGTCVSHFKRVPYDLVILQLVKQ